MSSESSGKQVNKSIQGLRGVAALTVMLVHVQFMAAKAGFTHLNEDTWIYHAAGYGVMLFFCISGYLIVSTLTRSGNVRNFAFNRVIRIYPLFLILHLLMFGLGPVMKYEWMGELRGDPVGWGAHFLSNLFFLPGIFHLPIAQKNAWSLSYEAAFYIIAACLFVGQRSRSSVRGKSFVLLSVAGIIAVTAIEIKVVFFAVGSLVWWLERHKRLAVPMASLLGVTGCLAGFALYCSGNFLLSAACAIPFFAGLALEKGWTAVALRARPLVWLGKVSYSLYLIHPFVLDPIRRICLKLADKISPNVAHVVFVIFGIPAAVIVAGLSYEFIEVRLTRLMAHCWKSS